MSYPIKKHIELVPPCNVCPYSARLTVTHTGREPAKNIISAIIGTLSGTVSRNVADRPGFHQRETIVTCAPRTGHAGPCMREQVTRTLALHPNTCTAEILNAGCRRTD